MKKIFGCFSILVLVIAIFGISQANRFWWQQPDDGCLDHPSIECADEVNIVVESGQGLNSIASELKEQGVISSEFWFKVFAKLSGTAREIQAGSFTVAVGDNYSSLVDVLIDAVSKDSQITIPEGYTLAQIGEEVMENFDVTQEQWDAATGPDSPFIATHPLMLVSDIPAGVDLEGYLFPDTYRFFEQATAEDIVERMLDEMNENIEAINPQINVLVGSPETLHDYITLASIIEREVRGSQDMEIVSGIFHNRLEIGMALQADSTVNYVTGKDTPGISLADTNLDSPYNTYRNTGLPPGPISNPGFEALKATANPSNTNYFYFLTDEAGTVFYAETFDQHVANKNAHLR